MKTLSIWITFAISAATLFSCGSNEEKELQRRLAQTEIQTTDKNKVLDNATRLEYADLEKSFNKRYIKELKELLDNDFEEKLNHFEEEELGFFASYKHMFKTLVQSRSEMSDYWRLKKHKHFSTLQTEQKMHELFVEHTQEVNTLRQQFASFSSSRKYQPKEIDIELPQENLSLLKMEEHSYSNLFIEFGLDIALWLLGLLVTFIITLIGGSVTGGIAWIGTILSIIISVVLSFYNDNRIIEDLRNQHQEAVKTDYDSMEQVLNENTIKFYEHYQ